MFVYVWKKKKEKGKNILAQKKKNLRKEIKEIKQFLNLTSDILRKEIKEIKKLLNISSTLLRREGFEPSNPLRNRISYEIDLSPAQLTRLCEPTFQKVFSLASLRTIYRNQDLNLGTSRESIFVRPRLTTSLFLLFWNRYSELNRGEQVENLPCYQTTSYRLKKRIGGGGIRTHE